MSRLSQNTVADQAGIRVTGGAPVCAQLPSVPAPVRSKGWRGPNVRGQWHCTGKHGCGRWLDAGAFTERKESGRPYTYCKPCKAKLDKIWTAQPAVAERRRASQDRYWRRERTAHRRELRWRRESVRDTIKGLIEDGYPPDRLCRELGVTWSALKRWRDGTSAWVHRSTYRKVEALASLLQSDRRRDAETASRG